MGKSIFIANNGKFLGLIRIILKCDEKMFSIKKGKRRNCPGVHWLRICLLIQRTWVWFLVQKDATSHGATKPVCHHYWNACAETLSSVQFSRSVVSDSLRLHGLKHARLPCSSPTPEAQTHVHWVGDAIQLSHPLSSPSPPALNLSQRQSLFQWVSSLHQVAKYWSFSVSISPPNEYSGLISFRMDWLDLLAIQGLSRVFSSTTVQKHQFFSAQLSLLSNSHIHTWLLEKPSFD